MPIMLKDRRIFNFGQNVSVFTSYKITPLTFMKYIPTYVHKYSCDKVFYFVEPSLEILASKNN